jgi:hypothetical protein
MLVYGIGEEREVLAKDDEGVRGRRGDFLGFFSLDGRRSG